MMNKTFLSDVETSEIAQAYSIINDLGLPTRGTVTTTQTSFK